MLTRRAFLGAAGAAVAAFRDDSIERVLAAGADALGRSAAEASRPTSPTGAGSSRRSRSTAPRQPQQRRRLPVAARRAGGDEAAPRPLERGAGANDVAAARAAGRVGAARARPRVRVRPRGDRDHAQRERGPRDGAARPRPEARRRGPDDDPRLPAHAHDVAAARAARRHRAQDRPVPVPAEDAWTSSRGVRAARSRRGRG